MLSGSVLTQFQIYWVGPLLGSLLAAGFYKLIKMLEYETANPGQDFDENETKIFDPERDVDRPIVNLVAPSNPNTSPAAQSRPNSGDTLGGYRREEIPLEQITSHPSQQQTSASATIKASPRGSSPIPAITKESEDLAAAAGKGDDIVHGGAHYSETAKKLDPRMQLDSEPVRHVARSAGRA